MQITAAVRRSIFLLLVVVLAGTARAERLIDPLEITRGDYLAPQYSPDGRELLVTGPQLRGLYVATLAGRVEQLNDDPAAGVFAHWQPDGNIAFRVARRDLVMTRDKRVSTAAAARPIAFTQDDRMYVVDRQGQLARIGSGDQFFGAVVSPDGDKVVFQGLTTGLYIYMRSTKTLRHIGPGTAPAWSPDSARVAYEVTEDDGHAIVASELYIYDLAHDRVAQLTTTDRIVERRPSFSPDGTSLAFDDNTGGIFVGRFGVR